MSAFSVEALWRSLSDAPDPPSRAPSAFGAASPPGQAWTRTPGPSGHDDPWSFGRSQLARVTRLRHAIDDSVPLAFEHLQRLLGALSFADVRQVLVTLVRDIALVWCGSVILGGGVGGVIGAFGGGVGAVPGAALGASVGASAGEALLALFGLKALAESMASSMPRALRAYRQGARDAWDDPPFGGADDGHESFRTRQAAWELAQGHLALLQALLTALLALLSRGGTARALALHEIGANARLGPAMARWLVAQEDALRRVLGRVGRSSEAEMAAGAVAAAGSVSTPTQLLAEVKLRSAATPEGPSSLAPDVAPRANTTRFVSGVVVVDQRTGQVHAGTVDLQPTLDRIHDGIPYPHRNDGSVFQNRPPVGGDGRPLLPVQPSGYYREYVVPTPGVNGPGPQRIVVGQGGEMFYTPDHYGTFVPIKR